MHRKSFVAIMIGLLVTVSLWSVVGSKIDFTLGTTSGNPSAGKVRLWANTSTGNLECLNSSGSTCFSSSAIGAGGLNTGGFRNAGNNRAVTTNALIVVGEYAPVSITSSGYVFDVTTLDATNLYAICLYGVTGTLLASTTPASYASTGTKSVAWSQGTVTIPAGKLYVGITGNASTLTVEAGESMHSYSNQDNVGATTGGACLSSITPPSDSWVNSARSIWGIIRH